MGLRRLDVRRGRLYQRCAKTRYSTRQEPQRFCCAFGAGFTAVTAGIGSARHYGARPARAGTAQIAGKERQAEAQSDCAGAIVMSPDVTRTVRSQRLPLPKGKSILRKSWP